MDQPRVAYLSDVVRVLRSRVSYRACYGLGIAVLAVAVATLGTAYLAGSPITISSLYDAQRDNISLLVLDFMPFAFALWGQYVSVIVTHEAGAMVLDSTESLRSDNAVLKAEARRTSELDALTGLLSRARFLERLEEEIAAAQQNRSRLALLVLDLDGFHEVNQQYGVANGDRVLKSIARRLTTAMPESTPVARLNGDSFAILISPLRSLEELVNAAQRIQLGLEPPCALHDLTLNMAASQGGAVYPDNAQESFGLLNAAQDAMQHAKTRGGSFEMVKSQVALPDADMHSLSSELRAAIDRDELVLHFQPIVEVRANRVHGVETLVRWQHPRRGLIMPGDFIPRAERSGLIRDLSNWVLRGALRSAAELRNGGWPLQVSVNLSARSLLDPGFPEVLDSLLTSFELPARSLILEITEDTLMSDQRRTMDSLTRVTDMGVQISIDDFGTGYSQLAYLKRLPASEIKIDRSFVLDMLDSRTDLSIVQATIGLAHALNLRAVGEGIESEAQAQRLRLLGCDLMQGFHIGRPMPLDSLVTWLAQWHTQHLPGTGAPEPRSPVASSSSRLI